MKFRIPKRSVIIITMGLLSVFAMGCNSGGGSGGGGGDSCGGPVPCATVDWGDTFYEFAESDGSPIVITSDGAFFGGAGFTDEGFLMALGGEVTNCNNGRITVGSMDYNVDGIADYWFDTASGKINICGTNLDVEDILLDGDSYPDIKATYVGIAASVATENQNDRAHEIIFETLDRLWEK